MVDGQRIPNLAADGEFRYLGVNFNIRGVCRWDAAGFDNGLRMLTAGPLKPQQRLYFLNRHLLPRLFYQMSFCMLTKVDLRHYDQHIRAHVRRWLRLPKDTPSSFIHAAVADGGLGVPMLAVKVRQLQLKRLERVTQAVDDPVLQAVATSQRFRARVAQVQHALRRGEESMEDNETFSRTIRTELYETRDGFGLREASHVPQVHRWISDGTRLATGAQYVRALRSRINGFPTKVRVERTRRGPKNFSRVKCDKGCRAVESMNHVSQSCYVTWGARVHRHNAIVDLLAKTLRPNVESVDVEPAIPTPAGLRKPDLVICPKGTSVVHVLDVQIVSCDATTLDDAHQRKVRYYTDPEIRRVLLERYHRTRMVVGSVTFNWRGCLSRRSWENVRDVGIKMSTIQVCATRILEATARMWTIFCRSSGTWDAG